MKGYKMSDFEKDFEVARSIGYFYEKKYNDTQKSLNEINMVGINNIEVVGEKVKITTTRPGILIGAKGSNIEALQKHLEENCQIKSIRIIEDKRSINIRRHLTLFSEKFMSDDFDYCDFD